MCNYNLRHANLDDVDEIYEIEEESFDSPWSRKTINDEIETNVFGDYLVVEEDGKIIGYFGMWLIMDEAHITNIAVRKSHRGKGIGSLLMEYGISYAEEKQLFGMTLEVRTTNAEAIGLYEKYGFQIEGIRPKYYQDTNEDAYIMWKYFRGEE
ncbi:MAG: ribosomal protein S18-alanine N-acetyltransferase [Tissierellia bacterium]|nr:ribosomal protein S18-alanine N-acetyltransferase [Tissierellia bacterium]